MKHITKKIITLLLALSLVLVMPAWASAEEMPGTVPITIKAERYDAAAYEVLELVNREREAAGLHPLTLDSRLQDAAMTRAAEAVVYFSHTRPDGSSCQSVNPDLINGENLAVAQTNPQMVVDAWMNSAGHRANILHADYNSIGIGCVRYNGIWFWCQTFSLQEGDGSVPEGNAEMTAEIPVMTSLLQLTWMGETDLDMAETASAEVRIGGRNGGWDYMPFEVDGGLFTFQSSDEGVLRVNADGMLQPVSVGTADITAVLKADESCTVTREIHVTRTLKAKDVKLSYTSCTYSGKAKKPKVTIAGLTADDYVVSYKNNVKVGTATVTITGVGDANGTVKKTFKINYDRPDQVVVKKPTTGSSHYVKARWYDEDCDGYQIRYATNSSFKNSKSIYVKDGDQLTRTIKNLKKGKRYYVKVRAYNNYQDTKVFGKWSKWRSVVCK